MPNLLCLNTPELQQPTIYIAIADDHTLVMSALAEFLDRMDGFKVTIMATDGFDLLHKIATSKYQPDVCLVDIIMEGMDGYETTTSLKLKYPGIKVLALTSVHSDYAILKMISNGAKGYVTKTADPGSFRKAITEVYDGNYYYCEEVLKILPRIAGNKQAYYKQLFTEQETKFLSFCCSDLSYKQIAKHLNTSPKTIYHIVERIAGKTGISSRYQLAMYALNAGIGHFTPPPLNNPILYLCAA